MLLIRSYLSRPAGAAMCRQLVGARKFSSLKSDFDEDYDYGRRPSQRHSSAFEVEERRPSYGRQQHSQFNRNQGGYRPRRPSFFDDDGFSDSRHSPRFAAMDEVDEEELGQLEHLAREREVVRNVYKTSEKTDSRSNEEIEEFYKKHTITTRGGSPPKPILTIDEMQIPDFMKKEFAMKRIDTPTAIQSMSWPLAMGGTDMIGIAQTGSGKTLGYLLPCAMHTVAQPDTGLKGPTALVLAPTRELVNQIAEVSYNWIKNSFGLKTVAVYGGASKMPQIDGLKGGAKICVATPGRLVDLLNSRQCSLANSSMLVLDEADRMLDMGFEPQIRDIIKRMRTDRQTMMFSATWPKDVRQLASEFMLPDTCRVNIGSTELCANQDIHQMIRIVKQEDKRDVLLEIISSRPDDKILIFARTKRDVAILCHDLIRRGIRAVESHGDLSQAKRQRALELFQGRARVMVATDVAARGLDVRDISLVINVDFPQTIEDYVHRIGRTGRSGNKGEAITLFTASDCAYANALVNVLRQAGQEVPEDLEELAFSRQSTPGPSFRDRSGYSPRKTFSRFSKNSNWRNSTNDKW